MSNFPNHGLRDSYGRWTIGPPRDTRGNTAMGADATSVIYGSHGYVGAYVDDTTPESVGGPAGVARKLLTIPGHGLVVVGTTAGGRLHGPHPIPGCVMAVEWFAGWGPPPVKWKTGAPSNGFILWWDYVPSYERSATLLQKQTALDVLTAWQPTVLWTW